MIKSGVIGYLGYINIGAHCDLITGPTIVTHPQSISVTNGQTADFHVVATGIGSLLYQWYKNGTPVSTNSNNYSTVTTELDDGAVIYCAVTDNNGTTNSNTAILTVDPILRISTQPYKRHFNFNFSYSY